MEAPPPPLKEKVMNYNKTNENNEKYSLVTKIKDQNSINISATFENDKTYEDCKLYDCIKKEQPYFEDHTIDEAFDEISELISKDSIELKKNEEQILLNIIIPSEEKKSLDFVMKKQNPMLQNSLNNNFMKDESIKQNEENMKLEDENNKEDKDKMNQINEEKEKEKNKLESINNFKDLKTKKSLKDKQINNQILNESKEKINYNINNKDKEDISFNQKLTQNEKFSEKEKKFEEISDKEKNKNLYNENQILEGNNNAIIIVDNRIYGNSSGRNFQINNMNNMNNINYQQNQNFYHKSKSKYFYICCYRGYCCENCINYFCFRCLRNNCKDCFCQCCCNTNCLRDCCNECCKIFCDKAFCDECCKAFCKCICKDCCGTIFKAICVDCCGSFFKAICENCCQAFCNGLCQGLCSNCQIF